MTQQDLDDIVLTPDRPWHPTPGDHEEQGPYADYTAFKRWFCEFIDDALPEHEDYILDALTLGQTAILYNRLAAAFDAKGGAS